MNRDTVLQIINQQKDKMTSEQLWCVVLLSGAFGALILNSSNIASTVPAWIVILLSVLAAAWGIAFVWSRHKNYMELQEKFAELVAGISDLPSSWLKNPEYLRKTNWWLYFWGEYTQGSGSYMIILLTMLAVTVSCYV